MPGKESKSNIILNQYLRIKKFYCYYEIKVVSGNTFNFSKMEENQDEGLPALEKEGFTWKLSDEDSRRKPCDGFCVPPLPAYLAIKHNSTFYMVRYLHIVKMKLEGRKSITIDECKELSDKLIHIA